VPIFRVILRSQYTILCVPVNIFSPQIIGEFPFLLEIQAYSRRRAVYVNLPNVKSRGGASL
jgi:hypothetical protein